MVYGVELGKPTSPQIEAILTIDPLLPGRPSLRHISSPGSVQKYARGLLGRQGLLSQHLSNLRSLTKPYSSGIDVLDSIIIL